MTTAITAAEWFSYDPTTSVVCEHCNRAVPIAPGRYNVSVPHVRFVSAGVSSGYGTPSFPDEYGPCPGNEKRAWRDSLVHPSQALAMRQHILDDDRYWEEL